MAQPLDTVGTYLFTVTEHGIGLTKRKFPQLILRLRAVKKYVDDPAGLDHFKLDAPQYVDWSTFDEETMAYLVLFNDPEQFTSDSMMLNYTQAKTALGWNGTDFADFAGNRFVGTVILGRVSINTYNGTERLQVDWIDNKDAPPIRELRTLSPEDLKLLNAKLAVRQSPAPKSVKPATARPPSTPPPPVAAHPELKPGTAVEPNLFSDIILETMTAEEAWAFLHAHKGSCSDAAIQNAWVIAANTDNPEWAQVCRAVVAELGLIIS